MAGNDERTGQNRSEWLAEFALETARLARGKLKGSAGRRSAGQPEEPEPEDWKGQRCWSSCGWRVTIPTPSALPFMKAVFGRSHCRTLSVHIGRFLSLYETADRYGIPRPTVFITEWGWKVCRPRSGQSHRAYQMGGLLYAPFPEVKGAAIWYLGGGFDPIHEQANA